MASKLDDMIAVDKRVRIIVGGPPGGGVDRYGRVPGRRIFRHIPFRPPLPRSDA